MKALTRCRRFLSIMLTLAIVFNSVDVSTINASATEVKEAEELSTDADESTDEDLSEDDENTGEEGEAESTGESQDEIKSGDEDEETVEDETEDADEADEADEAEDADSSDGEEGETESEGDADAEDDEIVLVNSLGTEETEDEYELVEQSLVAELSSGETVTVSGNLPEEVKLVIGSSDEDTVLNAIDLEGMTTTLYYAMSIHLEVDGEEYQPTDEDGVTLTFEGLTLDEEAIADMWFFHISDGEVADYASFANEEYYSAFSYNGNSDGTYDVTYTTSSFSDFVIASQVNGTMTVDETEYDYEINVKSTLSETVGYTINSNNVVTLKEDGAT
ncbi:MAG: hypothetical protein LUE24_04445, partial [Lachnospiraceae bacterium]|nr:hypothetical protein [Lachnospiraceae bacterium]